MGADQKVRGCAFAEAFVFGVATHDACGFQCGVHGQGVVVNLAGLQKFAQVLFAGKVAAQFGDDYGADAQAALCKRRFQRGLGKLGSE